MNGQIVPVSFIYNTGKIALAAAATYPGSLSFKDNYDFYARLMTITVLQANLIVANWGGTIQIVDAGQQWFNSALTIESLRGNGQMPYPFIPWKIIKANTVLDISLGNPVATATEVEIALHGFRVPAGMAFDPQTMQSYEQ
jgi:hypothetical protein